MTIGTRTAGAWAAGSTSISTNLPTSVAAGDMMVLFVGCKPYNATIADVSGWTRIGTQQTNGTTGAGTDTGSVAWSVFYRIFQTGDSAPTVSITTGNTALACIFGFTKTESTWATPTAYFGADTSSGTGYAITAASSSGALAGGDYLCSGTILAGNDADLGTPTCSATNATIGTVTQAPATNGTTNTGTDCRAGGFYAPVSAGISTADAAVGWTLTANQTGGTALVRVRETNRTVAPSTGTVRTVGQAADVDQTWSAAPSVGSVRLVGQTPTVQVGSPGVEISPSVGTLRLVGQTPSIQRINSWIYKLPHGFNAWTRRYDAGVVSISPSVGTVRLDGQQPTVQSGGDVSVTPVVGTLRIAGLQPEIDQTWSVDPVAGTFRITGLQPEVDQTWSVSPSVGTVRLVGQQPEVDQTWSASPSVGTLRLTGQQPEVDQTWSAAPTTGVLRLAGQTPEVDQTWSVSPDAGELRFDGQQPSVSSDGSVSAQPAAGTVRIAGQQPTVDQTWSAGPDSGTLRFDGQQPTVAVESSRLVSPYAGTLRITGLQPQIVVTGTTPEVEEERPAGGWASYFAYEQERERRRARRRLEEELEEARERAELADRLEQQLLAEGILSQQRAEELRLQSLVAQYDLGDLPNRVQRAVRYAERAQTDLAIQLALREMYRIQEEEELAVMLVLALD